MVSAEDIAKIAGVSRSTVSRVVNNYSNVPEETRRRVMEVIEKQGYVPQASARLLAGSANRTIGLYIVNRSRYYQDTISASSFFTPFTTMICDHVNRMGYHLLIAQYVDDTSLGRFRDLLSSRAIAGAILMGARNDDPRIIALAKEGFALGIIDQAPRDRKTPLGSAVIANFDNHEGAATALRHLYSLGHRTIAHVAGNQLIHSGKTRLEGFLDAARETGLDSSTLSIVDGNFSETQGREVAIKLLSGKNPPTAVFAGNDESALGVLQAAHELDIRIPDALSVIGFDDIELARYVHPTLTTIGADKHELAARITENLIAAIEGRRTVDRDIEVPVHLIERQSTARLKSKGK